MCSLSRKGSEDDTLCVPVLQSEEELADLYQWVDTIPLSRPKRNITRDFSDGVLMAELANFCIPKIAELHNYSSANSLNQKIYNWNTLNQKVFRKVGFHLNEQDLFDASHAKPGAIERIIHLFRRHSISYLRKYVEEHSLDQENPSGLACNEDNHECASFEKNMQEQLIEKNKKIEEMSETIIILSEKVQHLEVLLKLKEEKMEALRKRIGDHLN